VPALRLLAVRPPRSCPSGTSCPNCSREHVSTGERARPERRRPRHEPGPS
jgi:hypothetical protein